jgi:hypothetical protein
MNIRVMSKSLLICVFALSTAIVPMSSPAVAESLAGTDYATWGIPLSEVTIPAGSVITEATLTIYGLLPSTAAFDVYLLDNPKPGYQNKQKNGLASIFSGFGASLAGVIQNGNYICRFGGQENTNSESFVWKSFPNPFLFSLADGRTVNYTSSLLELVDFAGTGVSFGIGFESRDNSTFAFSSLELKITVSSYQSASPEDQVLTFTYASDEPESPSDYALQFDGIDDKVTWSYKNIPSNDFTVSAWVQATATHQIDVEGLGGGAAGQTYLFWPEFRGIDAGMGISVGTNGISVYEHGASYMPARAIYIGNLGYDWNHIAVTYTDKVPRIYLNGLLVRTGLRSPKMNVFAPRTVGGGGYGFYAGKVAKVCVWDRSLSDAEVMSGASDNIVASGLIGGWKYNEGAGSTAYDSTANQQDAAISGAAWVRYDNNEAAVSYALQFDGADDTVAWTYLNTPVDNFSVSAWVQATADHQIDVEGLGGGTAGQTYLFWPESGGTNAVMGVSVGTNGISVYEHGAGYMPARAVYAGNLGSNWNHIVVTYTNKVPRIYLNGILVRTGLSSPRACVFAPRVVGGGGYGYFAGKVANVRVWDRSLSDDEVLSSVSGAVSGVEPVGDWRFDEGLDATAKDSSQNAQHGTIKGAAWVNFE